MGTTSSPKISPFLLSEGSLPHTTTLQRCDTEVVYMELESIFFERGSNSQGCEYFKLRDYYPLLCSRRLLTRRFTDGDKLHLSLLQSFTWSAMKLVYEIRALESAACALLL